MASNISKVVTATGEQLFVAGFDLAAGFVVHTSAFLVAGAPIGILIPERANVYLLGAVFYW